MEEEWTTQAGVFGDEYTGFVAFGKEGKMEYQLLASSAREFGEALISAADAAQRDEDFCRFLVSHLGATSEAVSDLLVKMRVFSEVNRDGTK